MMKRKIPTESQNLKKKKKGIDRSSRILKKKKTQSFLAF